MNTPLPSLLSHDHQFKNASYQMAREARQHIERLDKGTPVEDLARIDYESPSEK